MRISDWISDVCSSDLPNPLARGLSLGRSHTLGVVVPFFTHPSAVARLHGVVAALDGSRYDLVLFNVASPAHRDEHFAALTRRDRADGPLVMSMPSHAPALERLVTSRAPVNRRRQGGGK